jgi:hypothetical protein
VTDQSPTPQPAAQLPALPPLEAAILLRACQIWGAVCAGYLLKHGFIAKDQVTQFISWGTAVVFAGAAIGTAWAQEHFSRQRLAAAFKVLTAPQPPVSK